MVEPGDCKGMEQAMGFSWVMEPEIWGYAWCRMVDWLLQGVLPAGYDVRFLSWLRVSLCLCYLRCLRNWANRGHAPTIWGWWFPPICGTVQSSMNTSMLATSDLHWLGISSGFGETDPLHPRRLIYTGVADISPENVRWPMDIRGLNVTEQPGFSTTESIRDFYFGWDVKAWENDRRAIDSIGLKWTSIHIYIYIFLFQSTHMTCDCKLNASYRKWCFVQA